MNKPSKRILIVDDSVTARRYLRSLLVGWGYEVEVAVTGYEGMEKALVSDFGLILADINMPTMNGYAMIAALRKEAAVQSLPTIMSSTESKNQDIAQAYAAGANLFLVKPVAPDILQQYVKFIIGEAK